MEACSLIQIAPSGTVVAFVAAVVVAAESALFSVPSALFVVAAAVAVTWRAAQTPGAAACSLHKWCPGDALLQTRLQGTPPGTVSPPGSTSHAAAAVDSRLQEKDPAFLPREIEASRVLASYLQEQ